MHTRFNHLRQSGATLVEVIMTVGILGLIIAGAATLVDNHMERTRVATTAQHMAIFGNAVQAYIKDNYANITTANTNGVPTATSSIPAVITVNTLQTTPLAGPSGPASATRYLPANFSAETPYHQTLCALILQPRPNQLYALIVTENRNATAVDINDLDLGLLAGQIGAAGGGIYTLAPNIAKGTMGKWEFNLASDPIGQSFQKTSATHCDGSSGPINLVPGRPLMALWFNNDTSSAFLYRDAVPNHPELNQMQTDLRFRDDIKDATGKITSPGASMILQVVRDADTLCDNAKTSWQGGYTDSNGVLQNGAVPPGTLARDKDGNLMMCVVYPTSEGGDNRRYWRTVAKAMYWGTPVDKYKDLPACNSTTNAYQTRIVKSPAFQIIPTIASKPRAYTCYPNPFGFGGEWQALSVDDDGVLRTDRLKLGTRVEGQICQGPVGALAQDGDGDLLVCAWNYVWQKTKSSIGSYYLQLPGYPNDHFVGTGNMSADGYFSGSMYCSPNHYGDGGGQPGIQWTCGSGGVIDCQSNVWCAHHYALQGRNAGWWPWTIDPFNKPLKVDVVNLRVAKYNRLW
jgi:type II secretory pathway pseudopilin PulG